MKVLVLGVTGMLGHAVFHSFQENHDFEVWGTLRSPALLSYFPAHMHSRLIHGVDIFNEDSLLSVFESVRPDLVINLIGITKQQAGGQDPLVVLPVNSLFPHRLAKLCALSKSRLIHKSTDCVFSGKNGFYAETASSDALDLYGQSKYLGELTQFQHVITIRTSAIGHESNSHYGLVDWFLAQQLRTKGYVNAVFSGLPAVELGRVMRDYIAPRTDLHGLYHVAAKPINKYELLKKIAVLYKKEIIITPDESLCVDRSLNAEKFNQATGYIPPEWNDLLKMMHQTWQGEV